MLRHTLPPLPLRALLASARRAQQDMIRFTRRLVLSESPSNEKDALDACAAIIAARASSLGARVRLHPRRLCGDILEARFGPSSPSNRILLLGHLDTVWPIGTLRAMPCLARDGRLYGPGVLDMKAAIVMALTALDLISEAGLLDREIILLLNSDEEIGSHTSRSIIERIARSCTSVFVLEPAQGLAYKTARKGTGQWRIQVDGVAAHAGVDIEKGASAVLELARIVETVSAFTGLAPGLTVNVGLVSGGSRTNVVPARALADVDVRIARNADGPRITRRFTALKPTDKRCTLTLTGGIDRPPMERTRGTAALYRQARAFAADLGFMLDEAASGGASDGNLTSAIGIPTLDGMGAVGAGAHAAHEFIDIAHLAPRTALLAAMLAAGHPTT